MGSLNKPRRKACWGYRLHVDEKETSVSMIAFLSVVVSMGVTNGRSDGNAAGGGGVVVLPNFMVILRGANSSNSRDGGIGNSVSHDRSKCLGGDGDIHRMNDSISCSCSGDGSNVEDGDGCSGDSSIDGGGGE